MFFKFCITLLFSSSSFAFAGLAELFASPQDWKLENKSETSESSSYIYKLEGLGVAFVAYRSGVTEKVLKDSLAEVHKAKYSLVKEKLKPDVCYEKLEKNRFSLVCYQGKKNFIITSVRLGPNESAGFLRNRVVGAFR